MRYGLHCSSVLLLQRSVAYSADEMYRIHCKEDPIYVFPEIKLRGLVPYSYIQDI